MWWGRKRGEIWGAQGWTDYIWNQLLDPVQNEWWLPCTESIKEFRLLTTEPCSKHEALVCRGLSDDPDHMPWGQSCTESNQKGKKSLMLSETQWSWVKHSRCVRMGSVGRVSTSPMRPGISGCWGLREKKSEDKPGCFRIHSYFHSHLQGGTNLYYKN